MGIDTLQVPDYSSTMSNDLGTSQRALRVAIVGSGPSGFYAAEALFHHEELHVEVGMFERLPAPFGLVRYGVAPDHAKIKNVIKVYEKTMEREGFHYFGNVEIGKDITVHQLRKYYDAVIFAYGAETDRTLNIEGIDLPGSHTATEFVAWYNGHPDFVNHTFDLSQKTAVIIGQGNVAVDVARILAKTPEELQKTDITKYALDQLAESQIKEIHMIGRRGPVQAAFTPIEIREFGQLTDCAPVIDPKSLELSYASQTELEDPKNAPRKKNYTILKDLAKMEAGSKSKRIYIHFRKSPVALYPGEDGHLARVILELNELVGEPGHQKSRGIGEKEEIRAGLFFRSIGYRGLPLAGLPFDEQAGVVPNQKGRVQDAEHISTGLYTVGWIKRGPSGIIGTNKPDSEETVQCLLEDLKHLNPCKNPSTQQLTDLLKKQNIRYVTYEDWKKIDAAEIARGVQAGKPREKFITAEEMLNVLG